MVIALSHFIDADIKSLCCDLEVASDIISGVGVARALDKPLDNHVVKFCEFSFSPNSFVWSMNLQTDPTVPVPGATRLDQCLPELVYWRSPNPLPSPRPPPAPRLPPRVDPRNRA